MGYYNTAFRLGHVAYCDALSEGGSVGYILPDLPVEEGDELFELSRERELHPIQLMTPTNTDQRLAEIGQRAAGFVYVVARRGVTGSRTEIDPGLFAFVERCRQATDVPLALGFGLGSGADLKHLQGTVEIGIVGSQLLRVGRRWRNGLRRSAARPQEMVAKAPPSHTVHPSISLRILKCHSTASFPCNCVLFSRSPVHCSGISMPKPDSSEGSRKPSFSASAGARYGNHLF